jgi:hypothetical protein
MYTLKPSLPIYTWVVLACVLPFLNRWRNRQRILPPGPRRLPILGSILHVPNELTSEYLSSLGEKYGTFRTFFIFVAQTMTACSDSEVIHLDVLGNPIVILNSYRVAEELLNNRSAIYSSRLVTVINVKIDELKPRLFPDLHFPCMTCM